MYEMKSTPREALAELNDVLLDVFGVDLHDLSTNFYIEESSPEFIAFDVTRALRDAGLDPDTHGDLEPGELFTWVKELITRRDTPTVTMDNVRALLDSMGAAITEDDGEMLRYSFHGNTVRTVYLMTNKRGRTGFVDADPASFNWFGSFAELHAWLVGLRHLIAVAA